MHIIQQVKKIYETPYWKYFLKNEICLLSKAFFFTAQSSADLCNVFEQFCKNHRWNKSEKGNFLYQIHIGGQEYEHPTYLRTIL